jgi:hypothetical protein
MAVMNIGIDTSNNKEYSVVLFGFKSEVDALHGEISKILAGHGKTGAIHWRTISKKARDASRKSIYEAANNRRVYYNIARHRKPRDTSAKDYYLKYVPNALSGSVERILRGKYGHVAIEVDNDYEVKRIDNGTMVFTEAFLSRLCFRLVGEMVKVRKDNGRGFLATIKHPDGNILNFSAAPSSRQQSKAIQLADLVLGYYLYEKEGLEKAFFKKI